MKDIPVLCAHDAMVPIEELVPNPRNPNTHPEAQIELLAKIIQAQGWRAAITVSNRSGFIVRGHGRLEAATRAGCKTVPVDYQDYANEADEWADLLADNRLAELAETDEEQLRDLIKEIDTFDFDLKLTGYGDDELLDLLAEEETTDGLTDEDHVPEEEGDIVTAPGDVWLMGDHRLMCADATQAESIETLMVGKKAAMVFTDPPYNVNLGASMGDTRSRDAKKIMNDNLGEEFEEFLFKALKNMLSSCDGALYVCMGIGAVHTLQKTFIEAGGHWSSFLIWAKNTFTLGRSDYQRQYEPILYGWKEGSNHFWCGARDQSDIWFFDKPRVNDLHPTMKPVGLVEKAIRNSSRPKELVLDPFGGSGSTLIACEKTGRVARLMELDPKYCDVIVRRWQEYTGHQAVLDGDERTFEEVAAKRHSHAA